jgi:hypothetical protein
MKDGISSMLTTRSMQSRQADIVPLARDGLLFIFFEFLDRPGVDRVFEL